jgi:protein-L-isoaspartate(D-aspartate) O-methyltransferase
LVVTGLVLLIVLPRTTFENSMFQQDADGIGMHADNSTTASGTNPNTDPPPPPVDSRSPFADDNGERAQQLEREDSRFALRRREMVEKQIRNRGVADERVLDAMLRVPRQQFVPDGLQHVAYADYPQPIGHGQTISQPYIVALMTEQAKPKPDSRALDIGTGSGYQAAVLSLLCKEVYSIEIVEPLAKSASERLANLGYHNVQVRAGDGYRGWPEHAPFDVIIVAAAPDHVPQPLIDQLAIGGRLVIPVGEYHQKLILIEKQQDGTVREITLAGVAFVPMTGEAQN